MDTQPDQQISVAPVPAEINSKPPTPALIKFIRVFLLILIVIGILLLCTTSLWVPKLVSVILRPESSSVSHTNIVSTLPVSSASTSSQVSAGSTSNWKVYMNDKYAFSFKYPQNWTIFFHGEDPAAVTKVDGFSADHVVIDSDFPTTVNGLHASSCRVSIRLGERKDFSTDSNLSFNDYVKNDSGCGIYSPETFTNNDGSLHGGGCQQLKGEYYLPYNDMWSFKIQYISSDQSTESDVASCAAITKLIASSLAVSKTN
jgi:hypothetical protein